MPARRKNHRRPAALVTAPLLSNALLFLPENGNADRNAAPQFRQ